MKRRLGHWAAEYTDKQASGEPMSRWRRTKTSLLAGRFIPTERAKRSMVARGNAFKTKENELTSAVASREREKAAAETGNVGAGKELDLDTIQKSMDGIAREKSKGRFANQYKIKDYERQAKEAMRDLIATGSTLELNGYKVNDGGKQRFIWQTNMWRDLLNGSPELYREIKGQAPDWVPHRTPNGLPKFRGEGDSLEAENVRARVAEAESIDTNTPEFTAFASQFSARAENRKLNFDDLASDMEWAESEYTVATELDVGTLAKVHPTYYERLGDMARKGNALVEQGEATGDRGLVNMGKQLLRPAQEFGRAIERIGSGRGGQEALEHLKGGADTMEHLDAALQYSGVGGAITSKPANWDQEHPGVGWKGQGSFDHVLEVMHEKEILRTEEIRTGAPTGGQPTQTQGNQTTATQQTGQAQAAQVQQPAWTPGPRGSVVFNQPPVVQPAQGGQFEVRIDHGQLAQAIGEQVGTQFRQALKESGLHQRPNAETPAGTGEGNMPPNDNDEEDNNGGDQNT
jgi:hypothetical protein